MAKVNCTICGKELGFLSSKVILQDGTICSQHWMEAGHTLAMNELTSSNNYDSATIKQAIEGKKNALVKAGSFTPTKSVGSYLYFDDNNRMFKVGREVFDYSNLLSFELLEDGETITKGGLGRAVAGGLLFGGVGAIVGGVTGGKKSKTVCTSLKIKITLINAYKDCVYIDFIAFSTKTNGIVYKSAYASAQDCLSKLQIIAKENEQQAALASSSQAETTASPADEIRKFKQLLDDGIITQEEFDNKKKQLLGI